MLTSLLTDRYVLMLFGALGITLIITTIITLFRKYRQYKKKLKLPNFKRKSKQRNIYKDVTRQIIKQTKSNAWPSFLCFYQGDNEHMLEYIAQFIVMDNAELIILNESQVVIIYKRIILFMVSINDIQDLDISALDTMLYKLYQKASIQLPTILLCLRNHNHQSAQLVLFQKLLSEIKLYQKHPYSLHVTIAFKESIDQMRAFFNLVKRQTNILLSQDMTETDVVEKIHQSFGEIRNHISANLVAQDTIDADTVASMKIAASVESTLLPLAGFLSDLSQTQDIISPHSIIIDFGIHPANYYYTFFEQGSHAYKKKIKLKQVAIVALVVTSVSATAIFAYNAYQLKQLNDYVTNNPPFSKANNIESAQEIYKRSAEMYSNTLTLSFLYGKTSFTALNTAYANFLVKTALIPQMYKAEGMTKALYLSILAGLKSPAIAAINQANTTLLSSITGLTRFQLNIVYQYAQFDNVNALINDGELFPEKDKFRNFKLPNKTAFSVEIFDQFIANSYLHITNSQLRSFIDQSVILYQEMCILQQTAPKILTNASFGFSAQILDYFSEISMFLPSTNTFCDSNATLIELQSIIPRMPTKQVQSFSEAIDVIFNYNQKIEAFFDKHVMSAENRDKLIGLLLSAQLNSTLFHILKQSDASFMLLDPDQYYQYTFKTVFSRNVTQLSLVYSKSILLKTVKPLLQRYQSLLDLLKKYNIDYSALDRLEKDALATYAEDYINALKHLIANTIPSTIEISNLQMFLIDVTSSNTPFSNMLEYIEDNTTFDKSDQLPKQLEIIPDSFANLNNFISSKEYQQYKDTLISISNTLNIRNHENYMNLYNQLQNDDKGSLMGQLKAHLTQLQQKNEQAYNLFKVPLEVIQQSLTKYLVADIKKQWDIEISPNISMIDNKFPFDLTSKMTLNADVVRELFGKTGQIYNQMRSLLGSFIHLDQSIDSWVFIQSLTQTQKSMLAKNLATFNDFYHLQQILWDKDGKPQDIDFFIEPMPFAQVSFDGKEKMALSFLQIGSTEQILGLNTQDVPTVPLTYNWQSKTDVSVGWLSADNLSYQKTYQGEWALFKMLADAKCTKDWQCTWQINSANTKVAPYAVSFKLTSNFLNFIKKT